MKLIQLLGCGASLVAIAGCTPMVWERPGAAPSEAKAQLGECTRLARDEAWRNQWRTDWPPDFYDPAYMPLRYGVGDQPFWIDYPDSADLRSDLTTFCMHSKGYKLTPVTTAS